MKRVWLLAVAAALLLAQPGPTRPDVDPAAADRGKKIYLQFCVNCHGNLAKGTEDGPDLIRSLIILHDRTGDEIGPALRKLADHKRDLTPAEIGQLSQFLKQRVEETAKNRTAVIPPNVLTGDAKAASRGNVPAMAMLGSLWENGPMLGAQQKLDIQEILRTGKIPEPKFKRNIVQSYCWRVRAALMDDFSAQYNLAMFRWTRQDDRFDNVIEADLLEADFWFRLGARDPDHDNSQVRGHIEPKMTTAQLEAVKKRVAGWKKLDFEQMKAAQIPIPGTSRTCDPMP